MTPAQYVESMVSFPYVQAELLDTFPGGFTYVTVYDGNRVVWSVTEDDGEWTERLQGDDEPLATAPSLEELSRSILELD